MSFKSSSLLLVANSQILSWTRSSLTQTGASCSLRFAGVGQSIDLVLFASRGAKEGTKKTRKNQNLISHTSDSDVCEFVVLIFFSSSFVFPDARRTRHTTQDAAARPNTETNFASRDLGFITQCSSFFFPPSPKKAQTFCKSLWVSGLVKKLGQNSAKSVLPAVWHEPLGRSTIEAILFASVLRHHPWVLSLSFEHAHFVRLVCVRFRNEKY